MRTKITVLIAVQWLLVLIFGCSGNQHESADSIKITISVKDEIMVNADTVSIDSLELKLRELGATSETNIRIFPDPEAGAGTIERVQRKIRLYKQSEF